MRETPTGSDFIQRALLAIATGLVWTAAFPRIGVAGAGWLVPGALLAMSIGQPAGEVFRLGYIAGLVHHLTSLHWLLYIPVPMAPIVGWMALSVYLALYPAAWTWLAWRMFPRRVDGAGVRLGAATEGFLATTFSGRLFWAWSCAVAWAALEMVQGRLFSGFPWNLLGDSQYRLLPLLQISAFTGVYGVSFLMAWFSVGLLGALLGLSRSPQKYRVWAGELLIPALGVVLATGYGLRQTLTRPPVRSTVKVALVQPSIPQQQIWDARESGRRFQQLLALSEQALTNRPQLLVWPEAGVPSLLRWDTNLFSGVTLYDAVTNLVRRHHVWLILGADDAEPNARAPDGADYFNSSFLMDPEGRIAGVYRKQRLVIFGEYVPLARWFPFLRRFTGVGGDFTAGKAPVTFDLAGLGIRTSVLICFEDVFPHGVRQHARVDLDFLVNITNDGWFGESAAQWQQAASAVFRAVENGLPVLRCANNGLTCWIDAQGRMNDVYFPGTEDIYRAGFKIAEVPVGGSTGSTRTFYRRHGDVFGWSCVILAALRGALVRRKSAEPSG